MSDIILTPEGKIKLEAELKNLKEVKRPEITAKIEQAKEMGDLSENAEYHEAKDSQGIMEARVREIEEVLKKAVINEEAGSKEYISMGTSFLAENPIGEQKEFTLVGYNEADPLNGRISNDSPMGQAFMNKKPGDTVEVEAPKGIVEYKIVRIL